jgi:hypothetical protein
MVATAHRFSSSRYLRLLPDGRALYAMALEQPRKVLKWFNPRTVELEKDKQKARDPRSTATSSSSANVPSVGAHSFPSLITHTRTLSCRVVVDIVGIVLPGLQGPTR